MRQGGWPQAVLLAGWLGKLQAAAVGLGAVLLGVLHFYTMEVDYALQPGPGLVSSGAGGREEMAGHFSRKFFLPQCLNKARFFSRSWAPCLSFCGAHRATKNM